VVSGRFILLEMGMDMMSTIRMRSFSWQGNDK